MSATRHRGKNNCIAKFIKKNKNLIKNRFLLMLCSIEINNTVIFNDTSQSKGCILISTNHNNS